MFPHEVAEARDRNGLVLLPVAPLEWHGPHLTLGCDPLLAEAFAIRLAEAFRAPHYPALFVGTERERAPEVLKAIGFRGTEHIEGMDFPCVSVQSAYYREDVFAAVLRNTLAILFDRMKFSSVIIVNGHGADNQKEVLNSLCDEYNAGCKSKRVMWVYPGFCRDGTGGSIAHAGAEEASMLAACHPDCVDLTQLPQHGKLKNTRFAIVDGDTFDRRPTPDHTVRDYQDPRFHTDPEQAERLMKRSVNEVVRHAKRELGIRLSPRS